MSLSLKHIPCPAGKTCTAFQCIFGHGEDNSTNNAAAQDAAGSTSQASNREPSPSSQDTPRKRIKVDQDQASSSLPSRQDDTKKNEDTDTKYNNSRSQSGLQTATRPVSPPPVRRDALKSNPASSSRISLSSTNKNTKTTAKGSGNLAVTSKSESSKQRKPESLNPRLLKSSPASHETRLKLLKMLHREFTRLNEELKKAKMVDVKSLIMTEQDLIFRALDTEQTAALEKPAVYSNVMKNKVMQYKRMTVAQWQEERAKEAPHHAQKNNDGGKPKVIETGLSNAQEVQLLSRLTTKIDDLPQHGYVSSIPSDDSIASARDGLEAAKGWEKCDRCQQRFQVFPGRRAEDGALTSGGACNFHWGKTYVPPKQDSFSRVPKRYHCCGQEVGDSAGCITHDKHVFKASDPKRLAAILNYAATPENLEVPLDRAVCFDCEMGYTVHGMELVRLTATSWPAGEELLDVLVQPIGEILDLNSRYSGVWPDDLAKSPAWTPSNNDSATSKATTTAKDEDGAKPKKILKKVSSPEVARDLLFSLISPTTPLIGHGLENDLNATRIVHPTLIDTVLLYPHKGGLPFRNSLKMLMETQLNKKIQQEVGQKVTGHDSAEDARAAGELVRLKVANEWKDMQRSGWKLVNGELWPPGKPEGQLTEAYIEA